MKVLVSGASGGFSLELVKHLGVFDTDTGSLRYGEINKQQNSKLLVDSRFRGCVTITSFAYN